MSKEKSNYVLPATQNESIRLERQARLYGGADFLAPFIADRPARVLEVGCGTGYFSHHLAKELPRCRVVALDADSGRLGFASKEGTPRNLSFHRGEMLNLPFEDGAFDFVFSRFVLVHSTNPDAALSEMARVTREGGKLAAYDMVHSGIWFSPPKTAFDAVLRRVMDAMRGLGMEPDQGLHLGPSMIRAGLKQVEVRPITHAFLSGDPTYEEHRANWIETVTHLREILHDGFDTSELAAAARELRDPSPDQGLIETTVLSWGEKQ